MPTITNVVLNIQHGGVGTTRTVRVTFTTSFNGVEVLAGIVFKAEVKVTSDDNDRTFPIGIAYIQATSVPVITTLTRTLTKGNLDEDVDIIILPNGNIVETERRDEWKARVTVSPVVFDPVTADSPQVNGSWGLEGDD